MNERLKKLYREVIMQHNAKPYHFEALPAGAEIIQANNPLCGDRFDFYLEWDKGRVKTARFHGFGCAISKASSSILTQKLEGKTLAEVKALCQQFLAYLEGKDRESVEDELLEAFAAVDEFPARKDCAELGWLAISEYLSE